jgi:hypothetical protein
VARSSERATDRSSSVDAKLFCGHLRAGNSVRNLLKCNVPSVRLDSLLSAYFDNGAEGDLPAAAMALRVMDQKAKLLGLYPDKQTPALSVSVAADADGQAPKLEIQFVLPPKGYPYNKEAPEVSPGATGGA